MRRTIADGGGPIERKVQMTGGSTYTVSIPKAWANERRIRSGSVVYLYPFEDRLVIAQAETNGARAAANIDVDSVDDDALAQQIEAAYAAGTDTIVVESDTSFSPGQRRIASRALTSLVGMQISSETERTLVGKSLLDSGELSFDATITQLRQISLSMHEDAVDAVVENREVQATQVIDRDDDVDRLFALVCRQFYRVLGDVREVDKLETDRKTAFTAFRIARQLERIADHAERIAEVTTRQRTAPSAETGEQFREVGIDARRVVRAALDGNSGAALLRRDDLVEHLDAFDRDLYERGCEDSYLYGRVLESIRRTAEYGGNIAEATTLDELAR